MSLTSSRSARNSNTPASLRKELRHLSRELPSAGAADTPNIFSSRKTKSTRKETGKENLGSQVLHVNEWICGGGVASPAVFSFSCSPPSKSQLNAVPGESTNAQIPLSVAHSRSAAAANGLAPGSVVPRGMMVGRNLSNHNSFLISQLTRFCSAAYQLPRDCRCPFSSGGNFVLLARLHLCKFKVKHFSVSNEFFFVLSSYSAAEIVSGVSTERPIHFLTL
jgi:hypothetical protein